MSFHLHDPAHVTGTATLVSATTGITMFGLNISELGVVVSACVGVVTLALHVWYTLRKDKRAREIHEARLRTGDLDGSPE